MLAVIVVTLLAIDTEKHPTKEELVISVVHAKYPQTTNGADERILAVAKGTCQQLDDGVPLGSVIVNMGTKYQPSDFEGGYDMMVFAMAEGIRTLCPQHLDEARGFANGG